MSGTILPAGVTRGQGASRLRRSRQAPFTPTGDGGTVTSTQAPPVRQTPGWGLAAVAGLGIVVAAVLAAYSTVHPGNGGAIATFGFSALLAMKTWFTTFAMVFVVVQVISALAMWGRLPGVSDAAWAAPVHRWSGVVAFVLTLPVAFQCIWSLGFSDYSTRTLIHTIFG